MEKLKNCYRLKHKCFGKFRENQIKLEKSALPLPPSLISSSMTAKPPLWKARGTKLKKQLICIHLILSHPARSWTMLVTDVVTRGPHKFCSHFERKLADLPRNEQHFCCIFLYICKRMMSM